MVTVIVYALTLSIATESIVLLAFNFIWKVIFYEGMQENLLSLKAGGNK